MMTEAEPSTDGPLVWFVEIPALLTPEQEAALLPELGPEDKTPERLPASLHPRVRAERILGRFYLRNLLEAETGYPGLSWKIDVDAQGKPQVAHPALSDAPHINLSHTHGALLCGLGYQGPLGVDIEDCERAVDFEKLEQRCFTKHEREWLASAESRHDGFFRAWTLKEAYLKAIGTGIRTPLQSIEIVPDAQGCILCTQDGDLVSQWRLETKRHAHFSLALCENATKSSAQVPRWEFKQYLK